MKGLKKAKVERGNTGSSIYVPIQELLLINKAVEICTEACASCWDTPIPHLYDDKMKYVGKRTKIGHTSVIEHSNVVFYLEIDLNKNGDDLIEFLSDVRYLHTKYKKSHKVANLGYLIIGGSWRAFADLYRIIHNMDNSILRMVTTLIYKYIPSDAMNDIIAAGILEEEKFDNIRINVEPENTGAFTKINDNIDIIGYDKLDYLIDRIRGFCSEADLFTIFDLLDFVTISVNFKNMSRIITQQLTRHRNAITQESQRYVNYSKGGFNSPALFKPDKYDPNHKYTIKFGGTAYNMTLQQLGESIAAFYGQLSDKNVNKEHALMLEDARGYLPQNIQCGKLYMTFTYRNFFKFLNLREDSHAQAEIRQYGLALGNWFRTTYEKYANTEDALIPCMKNTTSWANNLYGGIAITDDDKATEIMEIMENHIKNFDEDKLDPEEPPIEEDTRQHGEE